MLEQKFGCELLIDKPYPFVKITGFGVKTEDGIKRIDELSELVQSLKKAEENRMKILLLAPAQFREKAITLISK